MKPPICELCGADFRESWDGNEAGGALVQFLDYRPPGADRVGHPVGAGFFCSKHLAEARSLQNIAMQEALNRMRMVQPQHLE
jgi:hypothetical protein